MKLYNPGEAGALFAATPAPYAAAARIARKPRKQRTSAMWTMVGTWAALTAFAFANHGFTDYFKVLWNLISGNANMAQLHSGELMRMAPTIAAMVSLAILALIPIAFIVKAAVKLKPKDDERATLFHTEEPKEQYNVIMATLLGEELLARYFFLGVIGSFSWFANSNTAFYALFFLGNAIWAAIHLGNVAKKGEEFPIKGLHRMAAFVLPQFVVGFMITAIYLPFGLFGALIAHIVYDMVLFAADRVDVFNRGEKLVTAYHVTIATVFLYLFDRGEHSLLDMKAWLRDDITTFSLPGWTFSDYLFAVVGLSSAVIVALEMLLYDREGGKKYGDFLRDWGRLGMFIAAASFIAQGTVGLTYLPTGGVVIALAMLSTFFVKTKSGSGIARLFWEATLIVSLVIGGVLAQDPKHGLMLVGFLLIIWLPDRLIRHHDKDELPKKEGEDAEPETNGSTAPAQALVSP